MKKNIFLVLFVSVAISLSFIQFAPNISAMVLKAATVSNTISPTLALKNKTPNSPAVWWDVPKTKKQDPPFYVTDTRWADSVFKTLTPEERIAQLFMVAAYSNKDKTHVKEIKKLVDQYKIGGLIFFQGGPLRQARLTNSYQFSAKVPLFIAIDAEWGLAMRLDSTTKFPRQMTLGAIQNDTLIYEMGAEIARQCTRLGMQINFAPVVDVNNNPLNPVISNRSFGENKYNVTRKAAMYMKGMQDNKVLANAKHFPGHGDTDSDSHKTLPTVNSSRERLDTLELYPFKELIAQGLGSMMVAHLFIPSLDTTLNQASTLSKKVVTGLLKDTLGFKGLIFTDALNMRGVSKFYKPGEVDVKALIAGNDVLLFPEDVPTAIKQIKSA
ncbi:MAG: glycoside hydrolase family 3 N-terminal domain-containing protein, partial [Bacteroidota bacterium]|nr:glycoside hydrolase family 3 N-terminal domain-containing protein [Bacteroidota bacterium]